MYKGKHMMQMYIFVNYSKGKTHITATQAMKQNIVINLKTPWLFLLTAVYPLRPLFTLESALLLPFMAIHILLCFHNFILENAPIQSIVLCCLYLETNGSIQYVFVLSDIFCSKLQVILTLNKCCQEPIQINLERMEILTILRLPIH